MRKLLMLAALALAATVVAAPSAFAVNPDFPGDVDPGDWQGVLVESQGSCGGEEINESCEFASPTADWGFVTMPNTQWSTLHQCHGSIEGRIGGEGSVELSGVEIGGSYPYAFCDQWAAYELPWEGQICKNVETGEVWLRQETAFWFDSSSVPQGETFGRLVEGLSGPDYYDSVSFEGSVTGGFTDLGLQGQYAHKALFPLGDSYDDGYNIYGDEEQSCSWPELQA